MEEFSTLEESVIESSSPEEKCREVLCANMLTCPDIESLEPVEQVKVLSALHQAFFRLNKVQPDRPFN